MTTLSEQGIWPTLRQSRAGYIGLAAVLCLVLTGYLAPLMFHLDPYSPTGELLHRPSWLVFWGNGHALGTDDLGRDLLSRLIYGARTSLSIGFAIVLASAVTGTALGLIAGVWGGVIDAVITRVTDILMSLPSILLAIVLVAAMKPGLANAMLAVTVAAVPKFIRVVRSVAVLEMKKPYVLAARTFGTSTFKIAWSEVFPNCRAPVIVQSTLGLSDAILEIAALGFLGLGARPPVAEWGVMLADSRAFIESEPYMVILPGLCILLTVVSFNLLGDALRDVFDPRVNAK